MLVFEGVTKEFPATHKGENGFKALNGVDYTVPRGTITGIIGRSGAGKSTLVRLVNGLEKPTNGRVLVDGTDVTKLSGGSLRTLRRSVGMIFQHFNLLSSRTVFDNVAMPLEIAGMPAKAIKAKIEPLIDMVGLSDKLDRYPAELSGGQKQRVGIARALATDPKLLLSDEATSALDPETTQHILDLLKTINRELGLTVLLITHEMEVVKTATSRVAVMDGGKIVESGRTFDVFLRPQHATTQTLLASMPGTGLPDWIKRKVKDSPAPGDDALVRLTFFGDTADQPLVARLTKELGLDVRIMSGTVDEIAGDPFGNLVIAYSAEPGVMEQARAFFAKTGLVAEEVGYVD
ncbi:methionine ABC transporter ATP-binding protein [Breoghania corrubedonensis]|nr:methionine ABC transporter ATP-binding protein [Breoghania corrubedonensis]